MAHPACACTLACWRVTHTRVLQHRYCLYGELTCLSTNTNAKSAMSISTSSSRLPTTRSRSLMVVRWKTPDSTSSRRCLTLSVSRLRATGSTKTTAGPARSHRRRRRRAPSHQARLARSPHHRTRPRPRRLIRRRVPARPTHRHHHRRRRTPVLQPRRPRRARPQVRAEGAQLSIGSVMDGTIRGVHGRGLSKWWPTIRPIRALVMKSAGPSKSGISR